MNRRTFSLAAGLALLSWQVGAALGQSSSTTTTSVTIRNVVQQLQPDGTWRSIHFGPAIVVSQPVPATNATPTTTSTTTSTTTTTTKAPATTLNVTSFGAKPGDEVDDSAGLAAAFKESAATGKTVVFAPGTYIARDVPIGPGMTIDGTGATLKRAPMQGKWAHTLTTAPALYFGSTDSKPLVIRNLTFDGNASAQGPYEAYQLEQAHQIYLDANPGGSGRLKVLIEGVTMRDGVADGISVYRNVDATLRSIRADRVFRGGVVLTGGYSKIDLDGLTTTSASTTWWRTGVDVETDAPGYGGTFASMMTVKNLDLDGDLDINTGEHASAKDSVLTFDNVKMAQGPLTIVTPSPATISITRSTLAVGPGSSDMNRLVYGSPGLTISDSTINVGPGGSFWLYWALGCCTPAHKAALTLRNVVVNGDNAECAFRRQIGTGTLDLGGVVFTGRFSCPGNFVN